jgi:hypothetical protein
MLNGVATTPCSTFTGADGKATTTCVAVINSKGELSVSDTDTHTSLNRLQIAPDGSLKVSSQGTSAITGSVSVSGGHIIVDNLPATQPVSGTVNVGNLPATQQVSGTVNVGNLLATQPISGSVGVNNFPATQQVSGAVAVNNLPADQQIHGSVTVANLPAATGSGGVTRIDLPVHAGVPGGTVTFFDNVDVSGCRAFTIAGALSVSGWPEISLNIRDIGLSSIFSLIPKTLDAPGGVEWAYPTQPFSDEPFYATNIQIVVRNRANATADVTVSVFCQH